MWSVFVKAQITILDEEVQEKNVIKPEPFDSLSNISIQENCIQYKKYIGYKLYCPLLSNKYTKDVSEMFGFNSLTSYLKSKSIREIVKKHVPFEKSDLAVVFGDVSSLEGNALVSYQRMKEKYEKGFVVKTSIYKAVEDKKGHNIYTPYDSIQNTYFTILNIEIAEYIDAKKGLFIALEDWESKSDNKYYLRFTLKNETSGEELYWICRDNELNRSKFFLVPYFEKMQKLYKGQDVISTTGLDELVDINNGSLVNIKPEEKWHCCDVSFVHSKDHELVKPFFLLERDGAKVKIPFSSFTEECYGVFTPKDRKYRNRFILEREYDNIIAERKNSEEEQRIKEEERLRLAEQARIERSKHIIKKYGSRYGKLISEGRVCLNMTKEMCIEAWGEPNYINSTILKGFVYEQWVYWGSFLYFDNGILIAIQN